MGTYRVSTMPPLKKSTTLQTIRPEENLHLTHRKFRVMGVVLHL